MSGGAATSKGGATSTGGAPSSGGASASGKGGATSTGGAAQSGGTTGPSTHPCNGTTTGYIVTIIKSGVIWTVRSGSSQRYFGIRVDTSGSAGSDTTKNLTIDRVTGGGMSSQLVETYGGDGIKIGTVEGNGVGECGLLLNRSSF